MFYHTKVKEHHIVIYSKLYLCSFSELFNYVSKVSFRLDSQNCRHTMWDIDDVTRYQST